MATDTISKLQPHRTLYLKGFDRRGAAAAITKASASGFTVSGVFSDQADFAVLMLYDADDNFGHLFTSKYLPDFSLAGVTLEFDVAYTGLMSPNSLKYQSVPWGQLSYVKQDGTHGTVALPVTATTGQTAASRTFTVNGSASAYDRCQLVYQGNVVFDYFQWSGSATADQVAQWFVDTINGHDYGSGNIALEATRDGANFTVTAVGGAGTDGNAIELLEMHKNSNLYLTPAGASKLTGGTDPSSFHVRIDFGVLGLAAVRQVWLTFAPRLNYDSGATTPALAAFAAVEWSAVFSHWTVGGAAALQIAGPGSVAVGSRDGCAYAGTGWTQLVGFFYQGFAQQSDQPGDSVTVSYSCQSMHDLYLGTYLGMNYGAFHVELDGTALADRSTALEGGTAGDAPFAGRRLLAVGVEAGTHTVTLTVASGTCTFDYLQATVRSDVADPETTYETVSAALDFDTDQTYKIAPARALWIVQKAGFRGDLDFYGGVFFALKRVRAGGDFHAATVTLGGTFGTGSGFGDGDAIWFTVGGTFPNSGTTISGATTTGGNPTGGSGLGGTVFGVAVFPADTLATLAQRAVNAINSMFVGIRAAPGGTAGQLVITVLSPINGFSLDVSLSAGASGTLAVTGDIGTPGRVGGQEGVWQVDATQTSPLNRAFRDYLADLCTMAKAAKLTVTTAWSQELLAPPDADTAAGAWTQRYNDGSAVLTATGFGSWGAGYVESVAGSSPVTVKQTKHGYITGNRVHLASGTGSGAWTITATDADHYELTTEVSTTEGYAPGAGDAALIELQTSQCAFSPATVTPYLTNVYKQTAAVMAAAGLVPWMQFGEVVHWFFAGGSPASMAFYDAEQKAAATAALGRPLVLFTKPDDSPSVNGYADANFLRGRLQTHIHAIRTAVLAATAAAKFELLWPYDVNYLTEYTSPMEGIAPIGGRLNRYVNLPPDWTGTGSDVDRLKVEALAWGTTYRNLDLAVTAIQFYATDTKWPAAKVIYLMPWQNAGCPWVAEYLKAAGAGLAAVQFWAIDHLVLLSWRLPLPVEAEWNGVAVG